MKIRVLRQYDFRERENETTDEIFAKDFEKEINDFLEEIKDKKIFNIFHHVIGDVGFQIIAIFYE